MKTPSLRLALAVALSGFAASHVSAAPPALGSAQSNDYHSGKSLPFACRALPRRGFFDRDALSIVGLTPDQRLICFRDNRPQIANSIGYVSGLVQDTALIGIDYRVQDGLLYGVGNAGGVYMLNTNTAAATLVNRLTVALSGTSFDIDFNPAADRLRIIGNDGQNLRHNVNAGGVTLPPDGFLNYTAGVAATGVTGAAYTNNDLDASTATTLFDIDATLDQVAIQAPPNNGSLSATGKLAVDAGADVGFDIYSTVRGTATVHNKGYAVLVPAGSVPRLYKINLTTGKASLRGSFSAVNAAADLAIPLAQ